MKLKINDKNWRINAALGAFREEIWAFKIFNEIFRKFEVYFI